MKKLFLLIGLVVFLTPTFVNADGIYCYNHDLRKTRVAVTFFEGTKDCNSNKGWREATQKQIDKKIDLINREKLESKTKKEKRRKKDEKYKKKQEIKNKKEEKLKEEEKSTDKNKPKGIFITTMDAHLFTPTDDPGIDIKNGTEVYVNGCYDENCWSFKVEENGKHIGNISSTKLKEKYSSKQAYDKYVILEKIDREEIYSSWRQDQKERNTRRRNETSQNTKKIKIKIKLSKYDEFAIALGCGILRSDIDIDDCVRRILPATIGSGSLTMEQINVIKKDEELMGEIVFAIEEMHRFSDNKRSPQELAREQAQQTKNRAQSASNEPTQKEKEQRQAQTTQGNQQYQYRGYNPIAERIWNKMGWTTLRRNPTSMSTFSHTYIGK